MDYEKKDFRKLYEDLVKSEWFKKAYHDKSLGDCPFNIPELAESEDERIRSVILKLVLGMRDEIFTTADKLVTKPKVLAWLEKQKEQKPSININLLKSLMLQYLQEAANEKDDSVIQADTEKWARKILEYFEQKPSEWSEEDRKMIDHLIEALPMWANGRIAMLPSQAEEYVERLKSLRPQPKQEWDTQDKAIVNCIVLCLDGQFVPEAARKQALEWFNKHRRDFLNSPSWRPSEEQIRILEDTKARMGLVGYAYCSELQDIIDKLKRGCCSYEGS